MSCWARNERMLGLLVVVVTALNVGCQPTPSAAQAQPSPPLSAEAAAGRELFVQKGCVACHRAPGVREAAGTIGPDLRGMASRPQIAAVVNNDPANMKRWLVDPQRVKPGTTMPGIGLNDTEAARLTAFLETLK